MGTNKAVEQELEMNGTAVVSGWLVAWKQRLGLKCDNSTNSRVNRCDTRDSTKPLGSFIKVCTVSITLRSFGEAVCKVGTQDPENLDVELKPLVTAWWL